MELFKSKGMKALSVALVAAAALVVTVIIITFSGISKTAEGGTEESTSGVEPPPQNPTADLSAVESTAGTSERESTAATTETPTVATTEKETEPPEPVYELAFSSNGDGTCTLTGLGTYRSSEVDVPTLSPSGDIVTSVAGYAFYNETSIVRISLPSTIRSIGEYAFLGCSSLIEITVSSSNTAFKTVDGILFSKDGTRLICCPPMRGKTTCTLNTDLAVIESGAFSGVKNLKTIYYTGSAADWTEINIYANNELLDSIRLTCNYSEK